MLQRSDPALRKELDSFLSAEGEASQEFLEGPLTGSASVGPGSRLGPYEIMAFIGAGGMGEVYKARDTRLDRTVAIKVLPAHLSSSSQHNERFKREARAISALQHPNICTLHDVGQQDNSQYLVMEYLEGETLAERLAKGCLPFDLALRHGTEVEDALDAAHRRASCIATSNQEIFS
jgi:eukaryotic-like serine/threonine-protein kinase